MRGRKWIQVTRALVWVMWVVAVVAALFVLAVELPNFAPHGWPGAAKLYVLSAVAIVAMIVIGERRSRLVEWSGWILLALFVFLAAR